MQLLLACHREVVLTEMPLSVQESKSDLSILIMTLLSLLQDSIAVGTASTSAHLAEQKCIKLKTFSMIDLRMYT